MLWSLERISQARALPILLFLTTPPSARSAQANNLMTRISSLFILAVALAQFLNAAPLTLIEKSQPKASIHHAGDAAEAVKELQSHLELISGASVPIEDDGALPKGPAIVLGELALKNGLPNPPKTRSGEGYRVLRDGNKLLLAGETQEATYFAACHFLETLGVRWFMDNNIGTVIPESKTVAVDQLNIEQTPDFKPIVVYAGPGLPEQEKVKKR